MKTAVQLTRSARPVVAPPPFTPPHPLAREQAYARSPSRSPAQRVRERLLEIVEGPWAPKKEDLPPKFRPEMFGNTKESFRTPAIGHEKEWRQSRVKSVLASAKIFPLLPRFSQSHMYTYQVPVENLAPSLEGTTILHLSDIHFLKDDPRPILELQHLADWLERNDQRIDVLLISGDIWTKGPQDHSRAATRALARIQARASYSAFVLGNHDYHANGEAPLRRIMTDTGYVDLSNTHTTLRFAGAPLHIYGVDDAIFGKPHEPQATHTSEPAILLMHNLDAARSNFPDVFDFIASGHTHWGELRFANGTKFMNFWGYCDNINKHTHSWDMLTNRALSFVHPGLARYYTRPFPFLAHPPGFALHTLRRGTQRNSSIF